jgi:hypothetical protein
MSLAATAIIAALPLLRLQERSMTLVLRLCQRQPQPTFVIFSTKLEKRPSVTSAGEFFYVPNPYFSHSNKQFIGRREKQTHRNGPRASITSSHSTRRPCPFALILKSTIWTCTCDSSKRDSGRLCCQDSCHELDLKLRVLPHRRLELDDLPTLMNIRFTSI